MITVCCIVIKNEYTVPNCITLTLATAVGATTKPNGRGRALNCFNRLSEFDRPKSQTTKTINETQR